MNKIHLLWIIPICLMFGLLFYAFLDVESERAFLPLVETCIGYESNMDMAVILMSKHCAFDMLNENKHDAFCDAMAENVIDLYDYDFQNIS